MSVKNYSRTHIVYFPYMRSALGGCPLSTCLGLIHRWQYINLYLAAGLFFREKLIISIRDIKYICIYYFVKVTWIVWKFQIRWTIQDKFVITFALLVRRKEKKLHFLWPRKFARLFLLWNSHNKFYFEENENEIWQTETISTVRDK